jgi:diacylglycerol kinase (ATP)
MAKLHTKVIVNPAAGANSTRRKWPGIHTLLKQTGLSFDYQFTESAGHGIELAKAAASNGYRSLVAVGGDGTINEVANGILQSNNAKETSLGIICTGTGSDLSRTLGVSHDYVHACSALINPRRVVIDIGLVKYQKNGRPCQRYFVNYAGIGIDAEVVRATERFPKFLGGTIPYLTGLLFSFIGYRNKPVTFQIGDRAVEKAQVLSVVVANGRYYGGGMHIAPEAKTDDNLFDMVIVGDIGKFDLIKTMPRVYKGTHLTHPKVRVEKDTCITIQSSRKFLLHADGELLGEGPVSFSLISKGLCLLV